MDILERYYGTQTFTLYALFANVPGKKVWPRTIFLALSVMLLSFGTIFQVIKLIIERCKLPVLIELLPSILATLGTLLYIPYVAYATEADYMVLLSIMMEDIQEERTEEEDAIKRRYTKSARMFINTFSALLMATIIGPPLVGITPLFLDSLLPLNESRDMQLLANGEIFIDQQKYFYHIYFAQSCTVGVVCTIIGISENMAVIIGQHFCGMFAVVGFGVLIAAFYDLPLTAIVMASFCALTALLAQVTNPDLLTMKIFIYTVGLCFQLFLVSYMGQNGIDMSMELANNAYNAKWDICPGNMRRLLQMIILRSSKPSEIVASNMFTLSIENFMSVIRAATSFFMVLRQA